VLRLGDRIGFAEDNIAFLSFTLNRLALDFCEDINQVSQRSVLRTNDRTSSKIKTFDEKKF
jgi:hypothetical protein